MSQAAPRVSMRRRAVRRDMWSVSSNVLKGAWVICEAEFRRHRVKRCLHDTGHVHETDAPLQEPVERDFLGGVEHAARATAGFHHRPGDVEGRIPAPDRGRRIPSVAICARSMRATRQVAPVRPVERIADRMPHVWRAQIAPSATRRGTPPAHARWIGGGSRPRSCQGGMPKNSLGFNKLHGLVEHGRAVGRVILSHFPWAHVPMGCAHP